MAQRDAVCTVICLTDTLNVCVGAEWIKRMSRNMGKKNIAALTMVRNDSFFLERWVRYYGERLGYANLYVYFDGQDQEIPPFCSGLNARSVDRLAGNVAQGDRLRADFLSAEAARLFSEGYDMVIGTDVDEFLVVDPAVGQDLICFLSTVSAGGVSISGLGVDVGQNTACEGPLAEKLPFLSQRRYALLSTRYSKSSVLTSPVEWGSGFHRTRKHNFHIVRNLYLFHFGCVDLARIEAKFSDSERVAEGWSRHFRKRIKTITVISRTRRALKWRAAVRFARLVQNMIRPPYAWNKPAMFNLRLVVKIPERFDGLI